MNLDAGQKKLIVADREYHNLLFWIKNHYPTQRFKIITKDELLDMVSFSVSDEAYPLLLKSGCDYVKAKKVIRLLRVANLSLSEDLTQYYRLLSSHGLIQKDPYAKAEIRSYPLVSLFELQEDSEIHQLLERHHIASEDLSLWKDFPLAIKDTSNSLQGRFPIYLFPNRYIQYFHIFATIRKQMEEDEALQNDPTKYQHLKEKITLLIQDDSDAYYITLFSQLFHLPCMLQTEKPLLSVPVIKKMIDQIFAAQSFRLDRDEVDPKGKALVDLIDKYHLDEIDFKEAYADLLEILNDCQQREVISDSGITCTSKMMFDPDRIYVIPSFQQGVFYRFFDDKDIYSDAELVKIGANPSYVLTALDRRKKLNFLMFHPILEASRVKQHLSDAIYDSPFIQEFALTVQSGDFATGEKGSYTPEAKALYEAYLKDIYHLPRKDGESYRSYDRSFTSIQSDCIRATRRRKKSDRDVYSVTELETYAKCPYDYYLEHILAINENDPEEDFHARWFGNLGHYIFQFLFDPDFDYEAVFARAKERYLEDIERDGQECTPNEEMILALAKHWFKVSASLLREQCSPTNMSLIGNSDAKNAYENIVNYQIEDSKGSYPFRGRIDKILWTVSTDEEGREQRYYTIVDYKTGAETFDYQNVFLGLSLQLPFYYLALNQTQNAYLKNRGEFGGFGIQHIYASNVKGFFCNDRTLSRDNFYKSHALSGITSTDLSYITSFDRTCLKVNKKGKNQEFKVGKGHFLDTTSSYQGLEHPFRSNSSYTFQEMLTDAENITGTFIRDIQEKKFDITPKTTDKTGEKTPCYYCQNRDICYHNKRDAISLYPQIKKKFSLVSSYDDDDGDEEKEDE